MAVNHSPIYSISKNSKSGVGLNHIVHVLAHAVRNNSKVDLSQVKSASDVSSSKTFTRRHNRLCFQMHEANIGLKCDQSTTRLPLNMIVSKIATRSNRQENVVKPLDKFDSSTIRQLAAPSWREKEVCRKRLQSAYLHNRRKIEEIQAMKIKLKYPKHDPNDLIQEQRYHNLLSESQPIPRTVQGSTQMNNLPHLYDGPQKCSKNKSPIMESEDPLVDDVCGDNTSIETISAEKENFVFNPTPTVQQTQEQFIWNPVILPVAHPFGSAKELLKYNCSLQFEASHPRECYDSPGNCTTSSTSSGMTVAEEFLQLTYYAQRQPASLYDQSQRRRTGDYNFHSEPEENAGFEWLTQVCQPEFINHFEE